MHTKLPAGSPPPGSPPEPGSPLDGRPNALLEGGPDPEGVFDRVAATVCDELQALRRDMTLQEARAAPLTARAHPNRRDSATNLVDYLACRRHDLRGLQTRLASLGLSSLGRAESAVASSLHAVQDVLARLTHEPLQEVPPDLDLARGHALLAEQTGALLGRGRADRPVRIMVTMPSEAADEPEFVAQCVRAGMDVMRINCAHDDADAWSKMIAHLRAAEETTDHPARVYMDLAGPKIRTSAIASDKGRIRLAPGDDLLLSRRAIQGAPATRKRPARIACTLPEALAGVAPGHRVWFDDGKIGGTVTDVEREAVMVRIAHAKPGGSRLKADKGINLPDTRIDLPALTDKDLEDLRFAARHADLIGLSFARAPEDVEMLQDRLAAHGAAAKGVILKVETAEGFDRLPELLLALMRAPAGGVMIARGDLAVECGYERLAEVQEEILWLCEASHTPVIWATQVLETLAKKGMPTRAEVTDAAMAERAECVMLNKGPHILRALEFLNDVLRRMAAHQCKKTPTMRPLRVARRFVGARDSVRS